MEKVRTFEERLAEVFTKDSPFKTIEEYTEWYLSKKAFDLTAEAIQLEQSYRNNFYQEVSIEVAIKTKQLETVYDPTDLLIQDISFREFHDETFRAEEYEMKIGDKIVQYGTDLKILKR